MCFPWNHEHGSLDVIFYIRRGILLGALHWYTLSSLEPAHVNLHSNSIYERPIRGLGKPTVKEPSPASDGTSSLDIHDSD